MAGTTPRRGRGRPRLDPAGPASHVSLGVGPRDFAALSKVAALQRESIQNVIRRSIRREILRALQPPPR